MLMHPIIETLQLAPEILFEAAIPSLFQGSKGLGGSPLHHALVSLAIYPNTTGYVLSPIWGEIPARSVSGKIELSQPDRRTGSSRDWLREPFNVSAVIRAATSASQ